MFVCFISFPFFIITFLFHFHSSSIGQVRKEDYSKSYWPFHFEVLSRRLSIYTSSSCYSRKFPVWSIQYSSVDYFSILIICLLNIYLISTAPLEMKGALESLSCVTKFRPSLWTSRSHANLHRRWKWLSFLHGCTAIHWVANSCHGDTWTGLYVS